MGRVGERGRSEPGGGVALIVVNLVSQPHPLPPTTAHRSETFIKFTTHKKQTKVERTAALVEDLINPNVSSFNTTSRAGVRVCTRKEVSLFVRDETDRKYCNYWAVDNPQDLVAQSFQGCHRGFLGTFVGLSKAPSIAWFS